MKIGIDLDDVVFEFVRKLINYIENEYSIILDFEDVISYNFSDILKFSNKEVVSIIDKMISENNNQDYELCPYVLDSIKEISKNHEIYFITSRVHRQGTEESLEKIFSDIDYTLIFSSNPYVGNEGKDKGQICREIGIDFMVEDSWEHADKCLSQDINCFLIDKPWNKHRKENNRLHLVNNWKEIVEVLINE